MVTRDNKPKVGDTVLHIERGLLGVVEEQLSSQFTVNYSDGTFGFLFYADEDVVFQRVELA